MAVTIIPATSDDRLALNSAYSANIVSEMPMQSAHPQIPTTSIEDLPLLLTVSEVQQILGLGKNSAYNLLRSGKLRSIRIGKLIKIPRAALEEYLQGY